MLLSDTQIQSALDELKREGAPVTAISEALKDSQFSGYFDPAIGATADSLLPLAAAFSVHPISGFSVGAVAEGVSGKLYLGANMEFEGMPLNASLHAEQSALLNARMHGEDAVVALTVSEVPCGHCRQFLRELSNFDGLNLKIRERAQAPRDLLPHAFGEIPASGSGLLDSQPAQLQPSGANSDALEQAAIEAAAQSYVPYSRSPEGFALECRGGRAFKGSAAESIAFNPSVPGALVALNQRNLSPSRKVTIIRAVQAVAANATNSPLAFARALIRSVSGAEIRTVELKNAAPADAQPRRYS